MIVCLCAGISDRDVHAAAAAGARRCADVFRSKERLPRCGACVDLIRNILCERECDSSSCGTACAGG